MKRQLTQLQPVMLKGENNLFKLPQHLLKSIVHIPALKSLTGFRTTSKGCKALLPSDTTWYKYAIQWGPAIDQCEDMYTISQKPGYKVSTEIVQQICTSNDIHAMTRLLQIEPCLIEDSEWPLCAWGHRIRSSGMLQTMMKNSDTINKFLIGNTVMIYAHFLIAHDSFENAEQFMYGMIRAGSSIVDIINNSSHLFQSIYLLHNMIGHTTHAQRQRSILFRALHHPNLLRKLTSMDHVWILRWTLNIYVFHVIIEACDHVSEADTVNMVTKLIEVDNIDELNHRNQKGLTILDILYKKRPLNRQILQVLNQSQYKHDTHKFF